MIPADVAEIVRLYQSYKQVKWQVRNWPHWQVRTVPR